jgi:hypothetical protein
MENEKIIEQAMLNWNKNADKLNQWSELGQDEKDKLIRKEKYETTLYDIIDRYLYDWGAKQTTIDRCFNEILELNKLNKVCLDE